MAAELRESYLKLLNIVFIQCEVRILQLVVRYEKIMISKKKLCSEKKCEEGTPKKRREGNYSTKKKEESPIRIRFEDSDLL